MKTPAGNFMVAAGKPAGSLESAMILRRRSLRNRPVSSHPCQMLKFASWLFDEVPELQAGPCDAKR
jgi:hypothetical protein